MGLLVLGVALVHVLCGHGDNFNVEAVTCWEGGVRKLATTSQDGLSRIALLALNRHAGCIYEVADWDYSHDTYDKKFIMTYNSGNNGLKPVWWHYFNAHVVAGGSFEQHTIVMANPAYEGLGYLNFIVTFEKEDSNVGHQDSYAEGSAFTLSQVGNWYSEFVGRDWNEATNVAISSFPHNDLGKDFRFNIRILHKGGAGFCPQQENKDSYYWYMVNKVTIKFPEPVRMPLCWGAMDRAGTNGAMDMAGNRMLAQKMNAQKLYTRSKDEQNPTEKYFNTGRLASQEPPCSVHCDDDDQMVEGDTYEVFGIENTYSTENQEFGTIQEIWFQFYYTRNNLAKQPNFFNSFEVVEVQIEHPAENCIDPTCGVCANGWRDMRGNPRERVDAQPAVPGGGTGWGTK